MRQLPSRIELQEERIRLLESAYAHSRWCEELRRDAEAKAARDEHADRYTERAA